MLWVAEPRGRLSATCSRWLPRGSEELTGDSKGCTGCQSWDKQAPSHLEVLDQEGSGQGSDGDRTQHGSLVWPHQSSLSHLTNMYYCQGLSMRCRGSVLSVGRSRREAVCCEYTNCRLKPGCRAQQGPLPRCAMTLSYPLSLLSICFCSSSTLGLRFLLPTPGAASQPMGSLIAEHSS